MWLISQHVKVCKAFLLNHDQRTSQPEHSEPAPNLFSVLCPRFMLNNPTELSQTDAQSQNTTKVTQKQKLQHGIHHIRCPILLDVPVETLTGITSYLNPISLLALAQVNKYLNEHVKNDNTWRRALLYQFLGIGPESDLDEEKTLLLRRAERSWRSEFISRYRLRK